jgi:UDP-glucose 4-epimerase
MSDTRESGSRGVVLVTATAAGVRAFVYTSTTSVYSGVIAARRGGASWITEELARRPKNVYGLTKLGYHAETFADGVYPVE